MEFIRVNYPSTRKVLVDDQESGYTNQTLRVEKGHHLITLAPPPDFDPPSVEAEVKDTTQISPMIIDDFHPSGGGE